MNDTVKNYQQKRNAMERLDAMEQALAGLQQTLQELSGKFETLSEVISVLAELVGEDAVKNALHAKRVAADAVRVGNIQRHIKDQLEKGTFVAVDVVSNDSLVVFNRKDKDGKVFELGGYQFWSAKDIRPEFLSSVLGKGPGVSFEAPDGSVFEVVEIYSAK